MRRLISFIILLFLLFACQDSTSPSNNMIFGTWIDNGYDKDGIRILKSSMALEKDKGGYIFFENRTLLESKNSGWCGTPPIAYGNYEGIWSIYDENKLEIISDYWGGIDTVEYEIVNLTDRELLLKYIIQ